MQSVGITDNEIEVVMSANPDNVRTALAHIRERYGSVEAYLQNAAGVSAAELQQLHDNFLV
jgi:protein tyrosine/serine phosphatase